MPTALTMRAVFDIAAFDRLVGDAPIADVFSALAGYYQRLAEQVAVMQHAPRGVSRRLARQYSLADCELARDAARMVVSALSERAAANEAECQKLLDALHASVKAGRKHGQPVPTT